MVLQSTGTITLSNIQTVFGGNGWDATSNTRYFFINLYRNISLFLCISLIHSFLR